MRIIQETIVKPLPSKTLVEKHELFWRVILPKSFLDFLEMYHGAEVREATFECGNRSYLIERFLCLLEDVENNPMGIYDVDVVFSQLGERLTDNENLLGAELLPIASLFAGDFVCLDFRKDRKNPSIVVWDHEKSAELAPVTYFVADTFSDFIDKCLSE